MDAIEMPDRLAETLLMFVQQNNGALSNKRRQGEFNKLRDDQVVLIAGIVHDAFEG